MIVTLLKMFRVNSIIVVVLVTLSHLPFNNAGSCEETETAHVKLDLAKQSISDAKLLIPKCHDEKNDTKGCSEKDKSLAHLNAAFDLISEAKMMCHSCDTNEKKIIWPDPTILPNTTIQPKTTMQPNTTIEPYTTILPDTTVQPDPMDGPMDCLEIQRKGFNKSGMYQISLQTDEDGYNKSLSVYCDMETDGGGWVVIQRRGKFPPLKDFNQDWETYKKGFGDNRREFWIGNDNLYLLTHQGNYSVRFDMVDDKGEYKYAVYSTFSVGDENSKYVLNIQNHSGTATDDMKHHHKAKFSTRDRNNDGGNMECAYLRKSAFWYGTGCGYVNLNGVYQPGVTDGKSIFWYFWKNSTRCLQSVEIKIRQK